MPQPLGLKKHGVFMKWKKIMIFRFFAEMGLSFKDTSQRHPMTTRSMTITVSNLQTMSEHYTLISVILLNSMIFLCCLENETRITSRK